MASERDCSKCGLPVPDGYFICFRCGHKQPFDSPLRFGALSSQVRHKFRWAADGVAGLILVAILGAVVWPSANTAEPPLEPAADSGGSEVDGVAFPDRFTGPFVVPTAMTTQAVSPTGSPASTTKANSAFIRLIDPLDEPEYYCVDVPGAGRGVRLQSALQVHTCKPLATAADELFTINHPNNGQIYMEAYDLCVEAKGAHQGSSLLLKTCSESQRQVFTMASNSVRLNGEHEDDLCLAVAPGEGILTGAPSHLRRALTLESCTSVESTLTGWMVYVRLGRYCYEYDRSDSNKYTCGEWPE